LTTTAVRIMAMCAAGPPKPRMPSRKNTAASSRSEVSRAMPAV
jgi:hypothetical protein